MSVLRLKMLRGTVDEETVGLVGEFCETVVAERYSPLLAGALRHQAEALGVDPATLRPGGGEPRRLREALLFSEVFPTPHGVVAVEVIESDVPMVRTHDGRVVRGSSDRRLTLYGVGTEQIGGTVEEIGALFSDRFGQTLEEFRYRNPRFEEFRTDGRETPTRPTAEEEASARLLTDETMRQAAIGIASSGGLLRQDLPKHLGDAADRSEEIERRLRDSPLVGVDLVVTCKSRSTQVARAPSREALDKMAENGLKCACGRDVLQERIDEALTLTAHGREMLNGSYWMTVLVIVELQALGVELDAMLVEQVSGGDEMDFFADVSGELFLMELKDKEFNLGNAYSFGSKTGIFRPEYPVIVTSAYVGNDAKEHFEQAALARRSAARYADPDVTSADIQYIEGLENLRSRLEEIVGRVYELDAGRVLRQVLPYAAPSEASVIDAIKATAGMTAVHSDRAASTRGSAGVPAGES
jgi:hypothetical protein